MSDPMVIPEEILERVARGAELCDRLHPGWEDRIDLDKFTIVSGNHCIIGQLTKTYFSNFGNMVENAAEARSHGFSFTTMPQKEVSETDYLDHAWRQEIMSRRKIKASPAGLNMPKERTLVN
jgi:hypothetical protein